MGSAPDNIVGKEEGIVEEEGVMYVRGYRHIAKVAHALANETRTRIIELLASGPKTLDELSEVLGQSKANISSQIRKLEEIGIVVPRYQPGDRGIRKTVELRAKRIVLLLE
ncbi:arsR family transcriptional regulator [Aeropyrum pernix]|uniref:ArsR family transcriptional regulator n=2 Tax=Aeropyrum pernix TaxID=56636 RepID=A0A401H7V4_AERPX|nr:winged helix-turn-helix domain-containing protein [Aeropyrum pernix]GBF08557.1 arsR family transcriptional regulator [Aeropyrum pernix]